MRSSFHRPGQRHAQAIGFAVQPRTAVAQPFQGRDVVIAGRDPSQPGIGHCRIEVGRPGEQPQRGGRIGIHRRNTLVELPPGGHATGANSAAA